MKKFIKPFLLAVIYMVMQGIAGGIMAGVLMVINPAAAQSIGNGDTSAIPASWLASSVLVAGLLTVLVASGLKMINWKTAFSWEKEQMQTAWLPLLAAIAGIFTITVLEEQLQLEDTLQNEFAGMMHSTIGILSISVFAPIIEELCFREGIMGGMLRRGVKPWTAIIVSAVIFGLIHGNPVQIFGAGLMGIIFGIIYYKSGNIVLTSLLHVLNNSLATLLAITLGMDATLTDVMGSQTVVIVSGIISGIFCIAMFVRYWKYGK